MNLLKDLAAAASAGPESLKAFALVHGLSSGWIETVMGANGFSLLLSK